MNVRTRSVSPDSAQGRPQRGDIRPHRRPPPVVKGAVVTDAVVPLSLAADGRCREEVQGDVALGVSRHEVNEGVECVANVSAVDRD